MPYQKRLGPLDLSFLAAETRESMMHVGALMQFTVPEGGGHEDFLVHLMDEIKRDANIAHPWNLKLRYPEMLANPLQAWVEDERFDAEYHVRRSALPRPGGERELGILVSRLHSHSIDFHRPPWEVHFIEGLGDRRFAMYFKVHHSLVDGYTGMKLLSRCLSSDASERDTPMFFERGTPERKSNREEVAPTLAALMERAREEWSGTRAAANALGRVIRAGRRHERDLIAPREAPRSVVNRAIGRNRRFATQQFETERLRQVARRLDGTMNDVVLALCAGALRRLLVDLDMLPTDPMTAMIPVNTRPKDDPGGGNAVGAVLATLATDFDDALDRFRAIVASTRAAKEQLAGLSQNAVLQYSAAIIAPVLFSQIPGAAERVRPAFNVVVSNVPGPRKHLYFRGHRLDAYYPLSIPFHGYALNITVVTYVDTLNFGFTADRDALPHMQRLALYARDALEELEAVIAPLPDDAHDAPAVS
ncbi:MAG: wax ester/triacylglycerol synthase family O-acyltransferase [Sandaracinaceae bacterium]|nr:wax ester/triacylglycerol synthase family O-acyltransferase [Sandaracinaceae bacterium]